MPLAETHVATQLQAVDRKRSTAVDACIGVLALLLVAAPAAWADPGWYAGDIARFSGRNTASSVPERVQQGLEAGLDWVVLTAPASEGAFIGLADLVQEIELNTPRITPIVGTAWSGAGAGALLFGIDPRAPLPVRQDHAVAMAESHRGVSVFPMLRSQSDPADGPVPGTAFSGFQDGAWSTDAAPGGRWDEALTSGHRISLLAQSHSGRPGAHSKTFVWAESEKADDIIAGLRRGAVYVSENDDIHVDFQVNGYPPGSTVFFNREPYVRIRAYARGAIGRVLLIADGEVIWTAAPDTNVWEARFFLPLSHHTYVRAVLESAEGNTQTVVNPVFLVSEPTEGSGEIPLDPAATSHEPDPLLELSGIVEAVVNLDPAAQQRILAEFLGDPAMRYPMVWLLQNRADLVSDDLLLDLLRTGPVETRLGAAYAVAARGTEGLADVLPALLGDPEPRLRAYAARLISQFTGGLGDARLLNASGQQDPTVRSYLIRAYSPTRFNAAATRSIIEDLSSPHVAVSAAANDKLVALGTRDYRVIQALLDAAEAGNPYGLEAVGMIGDHRVISRLSEIYRRHSHGSLKRQAFLALSRMDAPYEDRKKLACPALVDSPVLDGRIDPAEWDNATRMVDFGRDYDAAPAPHPIIAFIGCTATHLYIAVSTETADSQQAAIRAPQDANIDRDLHIEIDVAGTADPDSHIRLVVNTLGVSSARRHGTHQEKSGLQSASLREPGRWTNECAIPLSTIAAAGTNSLRFNIAVVPAGHPSERLAWSITYGSPADPSRHGDLLMPALR